MKNMKGFVVLSGIGADRTGLVDEVAAFLADRGLNIEESRMAVLGGEFAMILLASGEESSIKKLKKDLQEMKKATGLSFTMKKTSAPHIKDEPALPFSLHASGMDHPGIVHEITKILHERQINIESLETRVSSAPVSGTPIFSMKCNISVPADIKISDLRHELDQTADDLNLDIELESMGE